MTSMKILAIDPGTKSGWAHSDGLSGTWDLSIRRDESTGMRLVRLKAKLNEIKSTLGVDLLVFEANRNLKHGPAVRVAGQIQGVIELWAIENGVEYAGRSAGEIKRHATGSGAADKSKVIAAAVERWPNLKIEDDNHADALWLLSLVMSELGAATSVRSAHRE
jgi:Holliday junction resolvasome RuvABC endonuclease subunit